MVIGTHQEFHINDGGVKLHRCGLFRNLKLNVQINDGGCHEGLVASWPQYCTSRDFPTILRTRSKDCRTPLDTQDVGSQLANRLLRRKSTSHQSQTKPSTKAPWLSVMRSFAAVLTARPPQPAVSATPTKSARSRSSHAMRVAQHNVSKSLRFSQILQSHCLCRRTQVPPVRQLAQGRPHRALSSSCRACRLHLNWRRRRHRRAMQRILVLRLKTSRASREKLR